MLAVIRVFLALYGLIALITGFMGISASYNPAMATPSVDNNHRFVAAIWASMSFALFYVAWNPSEVALFRFLMAALFFGGLVRTYALRFYPPTPFLIFGIFIEVLPTILLFWMHSKLLSNGLL